MASTAQARVLYWDPAQTGPTSGASGGDGTWRLDDSVALFSTSASAGGSNTAWGSSDQATTPTINYSTAVFGGTPGTVTVQGQSYAEVRFGAIQFTTSGYTLVPGATNPVLGTRITTSTIDTGIYSNRIDAPLFVNTGAGGGPITVTGNGTLTLGGATDGNFGLINVATGATVVLDKTSSPGAVRALGGNTITPGLSVQSGATVRLAGTGGDQIRDKSTINVNGTLDMNGRSEYVGPSNFVGATLRFTLGDSLGENDQLFITNASAEAATGSTPGGHVTTSGANTIDIALRDGVTSLAEGDYTLITAADNLGTAAWTLGTTSLILGDFEYSFSLANSTSTAEILTVTAMPVPEPATLGVIMLGGLLIRRRRAV